MRNLLHWLNFPQRVTYKLCLLTYKCLHGLAPDCSTRLCVRVATVHGRPRLRSSDDPSTAHPTVSAICRAAYYQLRQLRTVTRCLTPEATKTTVQTFISCRLDYYNALLYGIADDLLRRLQSVQNAAACLVAGSRRSDHITPVLRRLQVACEATYRV